jgi:simple sugar transport system substrate-binding protein
LATGASGKFCSGVHLTAFMGGAQGDSASAVVYNGAQAAARELGPRVDYVWSNWTPTTMLSQLRTALAERVNGVMMMGHPGDAALLPLAAVASKQNTAMEYVNVEPTATIAKYGGGYVGANQGALGTNLALQAIKLYPSVLKPGARAMVIGAFNEPVQRAVRENDVAKALQAHGLKVDKITDVTGASTNPSLLTPIITADFLRHPDTVAIFYDGGQTLGGAPMYMQALHKKPGQVLNIGFDDSPAVIQAFQQGYVQLSSDQELYLQGYMPILSLCQTVVYGMAPLFVDTSGAYITAQNYKLIGPLVTKGIR